MENLRWIELIDSTNKELEKIKKEVWEMQKLIHQIDVKENKEHVEHIPKKPSAKEFIQSIPTSSITYDMLMMKLNKLYKESKKDQTNLGQSIEKFTLEYLSKNIYALYYIEQNDWSVISSDKADIWIVENWYIKEYTNFNSHYDDKFNKNLDAKFIWYGIVFGTTSQWNLYDIQLDQLPQRKKAREKEFSEKMITLKEQLENRVNELKSSDTLKYNEKYLDDTQLILDQINKLKLLNVQRIKEFTINKPADNKI